MNPRLDGRTALVTGGSRGAGAGIARRLAAEGATVAVNYRSDEAAARDVVDEIAAAGGRASAFRGAVDDPDAVNHLTDAIRSELGPIDLLVSNAGTASRGRSVADSSPEEFERLMSVHAFGPLRLIRAVLPELRAAGRGDIVVVSSVTAADPPACSAPYTMAKAAMETAARTLAREERDNGIRVNIIAPGLVDTEMGARLARSVRGAELSSLHEDYPFGRVCQPDDIAAGVAFLCSADGAYLTGQRVVIDGGGEAPALA